MDREQYVREAMRQLKDPEFYQELERLIYFFIIFKTMDTHALLHRGSHHNTRF